MHKPGAKEKMMKMDEYFAAVRDGDLAKAASLLDEDPGLVNARIRGDSMLLNGKVWENRQVVDMEPDDSRDTTALHYAAVHGKTDLARLLLDRGADVHAIGYENNHEMTAPVVLAAWEGGTEVLRLLLENGADPNSRSSNGVTPLSTAIRHGKDDRVELLKQFGANE